MLEGEIDYEDLENNEPETRSKIVRFRNKTQDNVRNITIKMDLHVQSHLNVYFKERETAV